VNSNRLKFKEDKENSVEKGLEEAERILDDLQVDEPYWIKPYTDFDGPVRTRETGEEEFHEGVADSFKKLVESEEILNPGIISGRGMGYLLGQAENLDLTEIDVAGEMGAVYFSQEELEKNTPEPHESSQLVPDKEHGKEEIYSFNKVLFDHLAEKDLQLMYSDNLSNVVGSACIEAYGINLPENRFSVEDTVYPDFYNNPSSQDIQEDIKSIYRDLYSRENNDSVSDHFDFHGDLIRFDKSPEAVKVLTDALSFNPFIPWGFQDEEDYMTMYPEYRADPDFGYNDFENFVSEVVQDYNKSGDKQFWFSTYHDYSFDYGSKGYENLKTRAAEKLIDDTSISEPIIPTNTGDKPTDVLEIPNSIFFAQEGTEAEYYCERNDIPYVSVESTAESFAIQEELAYRRPPPNV
jgi:hypothetical protein